MLTLKKAFDSTVGKKFLVAFSGLALIGFILIHLLGNLTLYLPDPNAFNGYAGKLKSLGPLLYVMELGLLGVFVVHGIFTIVLTLRHRSARPQKYAVAGTKRGPVHNNLSSRNMIITGLVLGAFLIFHVIQFRFGPGMEAGYVTNLHGEEARDLHRLVNEAFHNPLISGLYMATMIFLGFHLRHGFWSVFQSLGAMAPRFSLPIYTLGVLVAIALTVGFLGIPVWMYFDLSNLLPGASS